MDHADCIAAGNGDLAKSEVFGWAGAGASDEGVERYSGVKGRIAAEPRKSLLTLGLLLLYSAHGT